MFFDYYSQSENVSFQKELLSMESAFITFKNQYLEENNPVETEKQFQVDLLNFVEKYKDNYNTSITTIKDGILSEESNNLLHTLLDKIISVKFFSNYQDNQELSFNPYLKPSKIIDNFIRKIDSTVKKTNFNLFHFISTFLDGKIDKAEYQYFLLNKITDYFEDNFLLNDAFIQANKFMLENTLHYSNETPDNKFIIPHNLYFSSMISHIKNSTSSTSPYNYFNFTEVFFNEINKHYKSYRNIYSQDMIFFKESFSSINKYIFDISNKHNFDKISETEKLFFKNLTLDLYEHKELSFLNNKVLVPLQSKHFIKHYERIESLLYPDKLNFFLSIDNEENSVLIKKPSGLKCEQVLTMLLANIAENNLSNNFEVDIDNYFFKLIIKDDFNGSITTNDICDFITKTITGEIYKDFSDKDHFTFETHEFVYEQFELLVREKKLQKQMQTQKTNSGQTKSNRKKL